MKKVCFLILLLFSICPIYPIDTNWNSDPIIIKNGVSNNTIYDVSCGSDGFIWLSTDMGITRYDGFRFRDYPLIMSMDSLTTPGFQPVKVIREGSDGLSYVLLGQGGIVGFDKNLEKYIPVRFDQPVVLKDITGFCWFGRILYLSTSQGLLECSVVRKDGDGEDDGYLLCSVKSVPLVKGMIADLCTDDKSNLFFSINRSKVMRYDLTTKQITLIKEGVTVNNLIVQQGYLWICSLWNNIVCYDLKKNKERVLSIGDKGKVEGLSSYVTDVVFKDKTTVYLTSWSGLYKLHFDKEDFTESSFTLIQLTQEEKAYLMNMEKKMTGMAWDDKQRILWISTFGGGIIKVDVSESMYCRVHQQFSSTVSGIVEDVKGYIWLTMTDGSIMKSTTPELSIHTKFEPWKKSAALSGSYSLYKGNDGNIWLGNNLGEIVFIDPLTDEIHLFNLHKDYGEKNKSYIHGFCLDSWNRLWVATSEGLAVVDVKSRGCKNVKLPNGIKKVFAVAEDKGGNVWLGTDRGLKRLEFAGEHISIEGNYERENGLEDAAVRTIYVNNYNQIYAAYVNVVIRIDGRNKEKVESVYTLQNGLTSGHVNCMVDDHIGNTWAGNNAGIMTIRNGQDAFYNYLSIGNCSAVCRMTDGRLLWTNSWGLFFFDPSAVKVDGNKRQLMLTNVEVDGETVLAGEQSNGQIILSMSPERQNELTFSPLNNNFHLYFSDLSYGMMERKMAYRLLPSNEDWEIVPLTDGLWYNGLPSGKYTLQAKLVFPDGREGDVVEIHVEVSPRWYDTIWAYIAYGLLLVILCYLLYSYLQKMNARWRIHRNREIIMKENMNMEKIKREQKHEIEVMRSRMLALFVHELRTPLSLIMAPLKDMMEKESNGRNMSLRMAYRNALRMVDACDQLMAIYGRGQLVSKLEVASYPVEKLIDHSLFGIRELMKIYSIEFSCEMRVRKDLEFYVDRKKIEFVIHNLLTNAFAHIQHSGNVNLSVCEVMQNGINYVSLILEDDGNIKVMDAEKMIDKDRKENDPSVAQLGFTLMKQIVEAHHGSIFLESIEGNGTKVVVNLPADKTAFEDDQNILFIDPEEMEDVKSGLAKDSELPQEPLSGGEAQSGEVMQTDEANQLSTDNAVLSKDTAEVSATPVEKKTILIIEDNKDIRLYLNILFSVEYNVLLAVNGQEGVDIAMKELPDLVICDVMMPIKDGFECCRELKEGMETCSIPIIMLTAKVEDNDIIHGLELGADDYIPKPFTSGVLKAKVRNLINSRQMLKQTYAKLFMMPGRDEAMTEESTEKQEEEVKVEDPFISSILKIVEENIGEADFSVKKLAASMNMSQPTLYRKVKQSTDYTIIELIRGVRMRRAGVLLKTKQYGVQEVAEMVGYNDIPTFRKHFVDAFGTTPSTYE